MKQTVNFSAFVDAFHAHDRYDQFAVDGKSGYAALRALFDYYEEYEESTGQEMELDVIDLCCDWTAYGSALEAYNEHYGHDYTGEVTEEDALEFFQENTEVIHFEGGIIVGAF